ncbi:MAG: tetratricopeptide repeat protein [Acidobacteriota bacterium]
MKNEPDEILTETLADLYLKQGMKVKARRIYEKLLERTPDDFRLMRKIELTHSSGSEAPESSQSQHSEDGICGNTRNETVEKKIGLLKKLLERLTG